MTDTSQAWLKENQWWLQTVVVAAVAVTVAIAFRGLCHRFGQLWPFTE